MRILTIHNQYQFAGGEDAVVRAERELLEERGHTVRTLLADNRSIQGARAKFSAALGVVYSMEGKRRVAQEIADFRPNVVHVHNFFPLFSPAIYDACQSAGVPVVQTLHNYRLACPGALFYREGAVCESCLGRSLPWPGVVRGCYRGSKAQSAAVALMLGAHAMAGTWHRRVDAFIALTRFQRAKMAQAGLPESRILVKPNFVADPGISPVSEAGEGAYALYVGRLSEEKGVSVLIEAYRRSGLAIPLKVIGEGPDADALRASVSEAGLNETIEFLGRRESAEIGALMRGARFLTFPSVWYEGFPMVVAEALANGLPVVTSAIGGLPEIVDDGTSGWLVPAGRPDDWADALAAAWADPQGSAARGREARRKYEALYSPDANYAQLMAIYEGVRG